MKVYNLTDVATETLERYGMMNQHFAVERRQVGPGVLGEGWDTPQGSHSHEHLVDIGALSIDSLPPTYVVSRTQAEAQQGHLAGIPMRHVGLRETQVAGDAPAAPPPPVTGDPPVLERHHDTGPVSETQEIQDTRAKRKR